MPAKVHPLLSDSMAGPSWFEKIVWRASQYFLNSALHNRLLISYRCALARAHKSIRLPHSRQSRCQQTLGVYICHKHGYLYASAEITEVTSSAPSGVRGRHRNESFPSSRLWFRQCTYFYAKEVTCARTCAAKVLSGFGRPCCPESRE